MTDASSWSGTVAAIATNAATRPSVGATHPSWTALNTVVASTSAMKPNGSGVASGRRTTRLAAASGLSLNWPALAAT